MGPLMPSSMEMDGDPATLCKLNVMQTLLNGRRIPLLTAFRCLSSLHLPRLNTLHPHAHILLVRHSV